jgi:hypothetical protein
MVKDPFGALDTVCDDFNFNADLCEEHAHHLFYNSGKS